MLEYTYVYAMELSDRFLVAESHQVGDNVYSFDRLKLVALTNIRDVHLFQSF